MIKTDGVQRGLISPIIERFERRGYKLIALKLFSSSKSLLEEHYGVHKGKPFYELLINYMLMGPIVCLIWEGLDIVKAGRALFGACFIPAFLRKKLVENKNTIRQIKDQPRTIRGDYGIEVGRNIIHASDCVESAEKEIKLWFKPEEIIIYKREVDKRVYENQFFK